MRELQCENLKIYARPNVATIFIPKDRYMSKHKMSVKKETMIKIKLIIKENIFKKFYLIGLYHFLRGIMNFYLNLVSYSHNSTRLPY